MHTFTRVICLLALLTGFLLTTDVKAQEGPDVIINFRAYHFSSYENAIQNTDLGLYASKSDYEKAVDDSSFTFKKIHYLSDGLSVVCYLYRPSMLQYKRYPAIIFNRGSYIRGDIAPELLPMFHRLAQKGFIILAPMYRGSDGGEGRDEMGGEDLNDLLNIQKLAADLSFIDMNNLFLYGESRGGMMVLQALREQFPANAAATFGAFTDLEKLLNADPERYEPMTEQLWPDYKKNKEEILKRRSAVQWAQSIKTPLMILHGTHDESVNPQQSIRLAEKLQQMGREYELVIYANDNHILSGHAKARDRRVAHWFLDHMK